MRVRTSSNRPPNPLSRASRAYEPLSANTSCRAYRSQRPLTDPRLRLRRSRSPCPTWCFTRIGRRSRSSWGRRSPWAGRSTCRSRPRGCSACRPARDSSRPRSPAKRGRRCPWALAVERPDDQRPGRSRASKPRARSLQLAGCGPCLADVRQDGVPLRGSARRGGRRHPARVEAGHPRRHLKRTRNQHRVSGDCGGKGILEVLEVPGLGHD